MATEFVYGPCGMFLEQARPASSRHWQLDGNLMAIGRDPSSAIYVEDTSISRHHADLIRHGLSWSIVDARSTNGTFVNNRRVNEAVLRESDRIRLGQVEFVVRKSGSGPQGRQSKAVDRGSQWPATAQLESSYTTSDSSNIIPTRSAGPAPADIRVDRPIANEINIAEKQYKYYVQQRESFLREVAATKTKARWLVWTGFLTFAVGFGLFAFADLSFLKQVSDAIQNGGQESPPTSPFGREVGGVPVGLIGWALGAVGMMLLIIGIVLHIVATSRRRRADREFPLHPPWQGAGPLGE
jgi:pSer/pThr/pTyr-binding forkhead associated (FHA) protein